MLEAGIQGEVVGGSLVGEWSVESMGDLGRWKRDCSWCVLLQGKG